MIIFFKYIFNFSILFLIIISLYPGSLLGFFLFSDFSKQPDFIPNPFGTTINHFISYFFVSSLGLWLYLKSENFQRLFYGLFLLSITLEVLQLVIPHRSFQLYDLVGNFAGVLVAYFLVKIYLLLSKPWINLMKEKKVLKKNL